ncbi:MAG: NAD(P)H-hydrate dehydratase [Opitutaceae bacterium]|nr:NAD(P)H-hydrate dehydratase [Opitutaceae bacterium]
MLRGSHPILSCDAARTLEAKLLGADEAREWAAMQTAGRAVASAVERDFAEIGGWPASGRILVLAGKGHNGGDALIAAQSMLERFPAATAEVMFVFGERALRPLAARAWRALQHAAAGRLTVGSGLVKGRSYELCLDGVFGFQFRPPAEPRVAALLQAVNAAPIRLRAAVDLPSAGTFQADFTYATGSVKSPVVHAPAAGRVRYLDLGFFGADEPGDDRVLTPAILRPLAGLRPARSDKRTYGHVFVLGGSRSFPGAILMTVLAAIRSGAGLVTAFVPESVAASFAARTPEAMWVGWPETPDGGLALEGELLLRSRYDRATALVVGPGLGREAETMALIQNVVQQSTVPVVIDADALQPAIVRAGTARRIVTPHAGEFARIAGAAELRAFAAESGATVVLKGPVTRIVPGGTKPTKGGRDHPKKLPLYHSFFGGPVLARGGSGDLLAGLIGGLLAQTPGDPLLAAARGVAWHGLAADHLARAHGQMAVQTTQLLDFLWAALRSAAADGEAGR